MKIKTLEIAGLEPAIEAMRLPMKSGDKSGSGCCDLDSSEERCKYCPDYVDGRCTRPKDEFWTAWSVGPKDHELSMKLCSAGSDHRKHIRLIDVWVEIQAPLYWHKEMDTYRFGVDKVSESTMHTLMSKEITPKDFELSAWDDEFAPIWLVNLCEELRVHGEFKRLNQILPQSYLQTRIYKISYEALRNMYHARNNHKLKEWHQFCEWIEDLPYAEFITGEEKQ